MRARGLWIWWTATASAAALVGILLVVVLTPSETPPPPPVTAPAEPAATEPLPPAPPAPVSGTVTAVEVRELSVTGSGLRPDGSDADAAVPVDQPAVDAAVAAAATWLDAHLTAAHDGDGGQLPEGFDGPTEAVTTGLAHPDRAVDHAHYAMTVGVRGVPEWLSVEVTVDRPDGSVGSATFVFAAEDDRIALVGALPGEGTDPPSDTPDLAEPVDVDVDVDGAA